MAVKGLKYRQALRIFFHSFRVVAFMSMPICEAVMEKESTMTAAPWWQLMEK